MGREQLVGTWKMISDERHTEGEEVFYPFGQDVVGQLMYDDKGFMSVNVTRRDRSKFASKDRGDYTPDEAKAAFESYLAYFGTYSFDEARGAVIHHVVSSTFPQMIGANNVRFFRFSGKRLILSPPPMTVDGKQVTGYITWERAE